MLMYSENYLKQRIQTGEDTQTCSNNLPYATEPDCNCTNHWYQFESPDAKHNDEIVVISQVSSIRCDAAVGIASDAQPIMPILRH